MYRRITIFFIASPFSIFIGLYSPKKNIFKKFRTWKWQFSVQKYDKLLFKSILSPKDSNKSIFIFLYLLFESDFHKLGNDYSMKSINKNRSPCPGLEPGLPRPERWVLTQICSRPLILVPLGVIFMLIHENKFWNLV